MIWCHLRVPTSPRPAAAGPAFGPALGLVLALLGVLVVSVLTLLIAGAFSFLLHEAENPGASLDKFMTLVERARSQLPPA